MTDYKKEWTKKAEKLLLGKKIIRIKQLMHLRDFSNGLKRNYLEQVVEKIYMQIAQMKILLLKIQLI